MEYRKIKNVFYSKDFKNWEYSEEVKPFLEQDFYAYEKVDGTNIRIIWDGYNIEFKGRTDKAEIPKPLLEYLEKTYNNEDFKLLMEEKFGIKQVVIYGEGYGNKIQPEGHLYIDNSVSFIGFDVMVDGVYTLKWDVILKELNIPYVLWYRLGNIEEIIDFMKYDDIKSKINDKKIIEGFVLRLNLPVYDRDRKPIMFKLKYRELEKFLKRDK